MSKDKCNGFFIIHIFLKNDIISFVVIDHQYTMHQEIEIYQQNSIIMFCEIKHSWIDLFLYAQTDQCTKLSVGNQQELIYSKSTFRQGVSNDGGSHVETSSICVVPLGIIVVSSIPGEPLRAKYYGGLEKTSISHDRKYCAVIG